MKELFTVFKQAHNNQYSWEFAASIKGGNVYPAYLIKYS